MKIAVTGAGGFVGRALVSRLAADGHEVVPIVRAPAGLPGERPIADLVGADWRGLLGGADAVAHLAARVHAMTDTSADPLAAYRRVNRDGALAAYRGAAEAGVARFLLVSTIKVNGEETRPGAPFRADDAPEPRDPYSVSKYEAERDLFALAEAGGTTVAVVRPPLVYGPGVRANFATMMKWLRRGVPLPLGALTDNRRSLVGIDNLVDLLSACLIDPRAAGETFMVSDGRDVSTAELLRLLGAALDRPARLVKVPPRLLEMLAAAAGRRGAYARLAGNLQADISSTRERLGWAPPVGLVEGLRRAAAAFR